MNTRAMTGTEAVRRLSMKLEEAKLNSSGESELNTPEEAGSNSIEETKPNSGEEEKRPNGVIWQQANHYKTIESLFMAYTVFFNGAALNRFVTIRTTEPEASMGDLGFGLFLINIGLIVTMPLALLIRHRWLERICPGYSTDVISTLPEKPKSKFRQCMEGLVSFIILAVIFGYRQSDQIFSLMSTIALPVQILLCFWIVSTALGDMKQTITASVADYNRQQMEVFKIEAQAKRRAYTAVRRAQEAKATALAGAQNHES